MIEARIFVDDLNSAKAVLLREDAHVAGDYEIEDTIYESVDPKVSLSDEFLRLRFVPENIWNEMPVILSIKKTNQREVGKESEIPLRLEFDTKQEAEAYYANHLSKKFRKSFVFSRSGRQHILDNGDVVDLEVIEDGYGSIEFKSATDKSMKALLELFSIGRESVIKGPSVVAIKNRLNS